MIPAGIKRTFGLAAVAAALCLPASRAGSSETDRRLEAGDVATNFVKALTSGDPEDLFEVITDPFTFEGRVVEGHDQIFGYIQEQLKETRAELKSHPEARIDVFPYQTAVSRFGKPPKKFNHIKLTRCLFAAVSFEKRHGFLIILIKNKKEGWRVTAVTD